MKMIKNVVGKVLSCGYFWLIICISGMIWGIIVAYG